MSKDEKLSFAFSSKSSKAANQIKRPLSFSDPTATVKTTTQFVTEFDSSQPPPSAPSVVVIPPIPNTDFRKKLKSSLPDATSDQPQKFVVEHLDSVSKENITYGLNVRSKPSSEENGNHNKEEEKDLALRRFKEDIEVLPEDRGMDEFKDVAVENFGAAILEGYGWKKGSGIGRNNTEDTKVVEYERRSERSGLGYDPVAHGVRKERRRGELVLVANENFKSSKEVKRVVRIVSGMHIGKKGEVVRQIEEGEFVVRLVDSGKEVRVDGDMICDLGSEADERCMKKLKELENRERNERKEKKGSRREKVDGRKDQDRKKKEENASNQSRKEKSSRVRWLRSHIRVKVISEEFKRGKWYLKKGEVVDVTGPSVCDISMDSGELIQGVDQDMLETALPKNGGSVVVLYGRHEGVYGHLVEKDIKKETGVVRDADSHEFINVRLDQIAEYVGDPSYLGY